MQSTALVCPIRQALSKTCSTSEAFHQMPHSTTKFAPTMFSPSPPQSRETSKTYSDGTALKASNSASRSASIPLPSSRSIAQSRTHWRMRFRRCSGSRRFRQISGQNLRGPYRSIYCRHRCPLWASTNAMACLNSRRR